MGARYPTPDFASVGLDLVTIGVGQAFGRIYPAALSNPLGYGKSPSRFSDPRRRTAAGRFGVLYLGSSLKVCFLESVLRDARDGAVADYPLDEVELDDRAYVEVEIRAPLRLIDLTADGAVRMGVPSDVVGASGQALSRAWSVAFYEHPEAIDGIRHPSRLNREVNLAVYDRGVPKLAVRTATSLRRAPGLAKVLDELKVGLV